MLHSIPFNGSIPHIFQPLDKFPGFILGEFFRVLLQRDLFKKADAPGGFLSQVFHLKPRSFGGHGPIIAFNYY